MTPSNPERRLSQIEATLSAIERTLKEQSLILFQLQTDVSASRNLYETLEEKYDTLLGFSEETIRTLKDLRDEKTAHQNAHDRFEKRIQALERKAAT